MSFKGMLLKAGIVPGAGFVRSVTLSGAAATGIKLSGTYTTAAIQIGTDDSKLTMAAYNDYAIDINTTCAVTANSDTPVNAFHLKSTTTGVQSEDRTMSVESYTTVYSGNENTVGHFYSNWVGTGIGPLGLASAVTAKMLLPTNCTGAFFAFYGKMNMPAVPNIIDPASGAGNSAGWFLLSTGGTGVASFSNYGRFMEIHNIVAGTDKMLSLTGQTLRCAVPDASTIRHLVLSQMADGLGLGNSGTDMVLGTTSTNKAVAIYTESKAVTGDVKPFYMRHTVKAAGATAHRAEFATRSEFQMGNYCNALKGYMSLGDAGSTTGLASGVCAELQFVDGADPAGAYYPLEVEMVFQTSSTSAATFGGNCGFIWLGATQASGTPFDEDGFLMFIKGLTGGSGNMLSANSQTLKINLNPSGSTMTTRYMVLSNAENCLNIAATVASAIVLSSGTFATADITLQEGATILNEAPGAYMAGGGIVMDETISAADAGWYYGIRSNPIFTANQGAAGEGVGGLSVYPTVTGDNVIIETFNVLEVGVDAKNSSGGGNYLRMVYLVADLGSNAWTEAYGIDIYNAGSDAWTAGVRCAGPMDTAFQIDGAVDHVLKVTAASNCCAVNTATPAVAPAYDIVIDVDGVDHYIPVYSDRTWNA